MEIYDNNNNNMEAQTDKIETHQKLQFLRGCYQNFGWNGKLRVVCRTLFWLSCLHDPNSL